VTDESPVKPISTLGTRRRKCNEYKGERGLYGEEMLLDLMKRVAESMTAESSADNNYSIKRSRLGEQRKAETESIINFLSQKRDIS
jgi:hypothetical protein